MLNLFQHLAGPERLNLSNLDDRVKKLAQWTFESKYLVVFTGAGISTETCLPYFRGPDGIWTRQGKGVPPKTQPFAPVEPNAGHQAR
jgi:NAD-dependent deacetylase sirtuin 7